MSKGDDDVTPKKVESLVKQKRPLEIRFSVTSLDGAA